VPRADDDSAELVRHPLLASLGRDARELHRTLRSFAADDAALPVRDEPTTLLGWLQSDLRANYAPSPAERTGRVVADGDRSVQVHAAHGPSRQVEVLREVLVGLLQDDPTLEPRDVLVMCPDIETYAPLVAAGFGLADLDQEATHPAHRLRVRMADRALSSTNPLLRTALALVLLAGGRVSAPEVLDLAGSEPVRRRFRFSDDDLARIDRWVADAGIRWGLDADHRAPFGMSRFGHNTWRMGLDRLLLGIAMSGDGYHALGRGLPVDDVGSSDIDLVGRFAELVDVVTRAVTAFESAATVDDWTAALRAAVADLTEVDRDDAWQVPQFESELARATASAASSEVPLRLADVRALLESRLGGRPTRANFRTGTLTVSTMVPMRSVPHRVVCLVGLDDDVFPRSPHVDGDDVLMRRPLTGERDPRSEDRQLLLDAVLAATETLVITYTGANEQSGAERPPSVPLGEIIDALDRTASGHDGTAVRDHVLRRHPLQPYDTRNFTPGLAVGQATPLSFDATALLGAESAAGQRHPAPPLLPGPLPPAPSGDVTLEELKDFLRHPVRSFLKARLNVTSPLESKEVADEIPVQLVGLERWAIGDRFVRELMAGLDVETVIAAEHLRGSLPPGPLGTRELTEIAGSARELLQATADLRAGAPRSFDVTIDLGGRQVTGTVGPVYGNQLVAVGYSRLKPAHRLNAWVDLLALSVAFPDQNWTAHTVGKHSSGAQRALAGPLDHRALDWLRDLVALRDEGLCEPLPLPVETAAAWAGSRTDPQADADKRWRTDRFGGGIPGEDADPYHARVFGSNAPLSVLVEAGLPRLARRLWAPLVDGAEKVGKL
jgi:exodeoxyribonuclease V gamma subunit